MRRRTAAASGGAFLVAALALTGCGDGTPPSPSGIGSALSSLGSQASSAIPSLTDTPSLSRSPETTEAETPTSPEETAGATGTAEPTKTAEPTQTSEPPTSEPPTSEPPTSEPTTAEPTTPEPTEITSAASTTPEPTPTTSAEPAATESSTSPWLWLLALVLLAGAIVGMVVYGRRRSAATAWDRTYDNAATQVRWVDQTLVQAVVAAPSPAALDDAWRRAAPGIDQVDQQLFTAAAAAPDPQRQLRAQGTREALAGVKQSLQRVSDLSLAGAEGDEQRQAVSTVEQARGKLLASLTEKPSPRAQTGPLD